MKKRLLSAALALAMVLTLLPVSAFATPAAVTKADARANGFKSGASITYYKDADAELGIDADSWYYKFRATGATKDSYYKVTSGVIATASTSVGNPATSGAWYPDFAWNGDAYNQDTTHNLKFSSFTLLSPMQIDAAVTQSLTVDLNGNTLTLAGGIDYSKVSSITVYDNKYIKAVREGRSATPAQITGTNLFTSALKKDFSITAYGANVGTISLTGYATHSVTLDQGATATAVTLSGIKADQTDKKQTLHLKNASSVTGAVNIDGAYSTITLDPNSLGFGSSLGSTVDLTGDNCTVTLNTGASVGGAGQATMTVTGKNSQVVANGGNITGATLLDGAGTSMRVSGAANTGAITLKVTNGKKGDKAPSLSHTGTGTIGPIYANQMGLIEDPNVISITGKGHVQGKSNFVNATVTVTDSHIEEIEAFVKGTLTVTGTQNITQSASVGAISGIGTTGTRTGQVTIKVSGTNVQMGGMTAVNNNVNPINIDLSGDTNKYLGTDPVPTDKMRAGGTVKISGGTFSKSITKPAANDAGYTNYVPSSLLFEIVDAATNPTAYTYVDTIQKAQQIQGGDTTKYVVRWRDDYPTTGAQDLTLKIGGKTELVISAKVGAVLPLPTSLSGRNNIKTWTDTNSTTSDVKSYTAGKTITMDADGITLEALDVELDVTEITDITVVSPAGVTATLNKGSKSIALGGVVDFTTAQVDVVLNVKTSNAKETEVTVTYTKALNTTVFSGVGSPANGLEIKGSGELEVPGGARYTATSSFTDLNKALKVGGMTGDTTAVHATINVPGWNNEQKTITKNALEGFAAGAAPTATANFSGSNAIWGAVNKVMASTNSRVSSLLTTANTNYCKQILKINNPTATQVQNQGIFTTIWIYAYLDVRVKTINDGLMTADLVPSYKLIAGIATPPSTAQLAELERVTTTLKVTGSCALAQDLTSLGTLTGTAGKVKFKLGKWAPYTAPDAPVAHQDGKYAYVGDVTGNGTTTTGEFTVTHISTSNGLGAFVFNSTAPLVALERWDSTPTADYKVVDYYDDLQSAANDTKYVNTTAPSTLKEDVVQVYSGYTGPTAISLSGERRVFIIKTASGVKPVSITNSQADGWQLDNNATNTEYKVQLFRNTAAQPTEKPVTITVATAANGLATANVSKADYGETVTITVKPNAGYGLSTLTIRTNTGANVAYQSTTTNVFTFKVPENVTSITVTPAFAVSSTATISVTDTVNGLATTNAANNKAAGGSTVTVTTRPFNGYRTSAVTAVSNTGAAVAVTRVAENTYTFVVPIAATSVVITPTFTASGHPFTDVADGQWYSDAVSFGYRHGMFTGYNGSTTRFAGMERLTRAELVQILYRLSGEPATTSNSGFSDVNSNAWYAKAITWATRNNIVRGGDNNRFYPLNYVTREELAQMLYSYNSFRGGSTGLTGNLSRFTDANRVHAYHLTAMQWAVGNSVVQGTGSQLNPGGTATRYEAATMLMRYGQSFMGLT